MGPRCSFCGTSTGPFREVGGLFTVLMCTRCRAVRQASPPPLLVYHDPGEPWWQWGCPIQSKWPLRGRRAGVKTSPYRGEVCLFSGQGCGHRVIIPHELEGHTAAEHPGWVARYELVRPYPNQLERVVYDCQVEDPPPT